MLAISQSLNVSKAKISFDVSIWTAIVFLVGFNLTFAYLRFVFTCRDRTPRLFRRGCMGVLVVLAAGALLYPIRSVPMEKVATGLAGVGAAVCFIATGLTLICRIMLAAEREEQGQEAKEHNSVTVKSRSQASPEQKEGAYDNCGN